ncbi:MAG: protein-disulfide reductase DsbD [Betaproteobacteria bacterium]|nr:MAG: protein-disulfide reductase DsbD [Betaproteobacteria bacterium]
MHRLLLTLLLLLAALPPACAAGADDLLEPDKAFRFSARALDARTVEVRYGIADGYYLYRDRFRFAAEPASVALGQPQFPKGQIHEDKFFGKQETYRKEVRIRLPVEAAGAERLKLQVTSQGCADLGVCYVPQVQSADLRLASLGGSRSSILRESEPFASSPERVTAASDDVRFAGVLESGRLWLVIAVFFGAGLLLTFTPCVLPMIPILSGIIVGEGRKVTRRRAALVSLAYVLGMAVTYTAIGIAAAFSGNLLTAALQNTWVLGAFAAVFVGLALSMFGFYELRLPSSWQARLTAASNRLGGGDWGAVVLMGALSAAIVSPCVAAPLAGALLYIGQTRDALLGGTALFSMAIGMGVPLVLVGVSEGALLPRSGPWMHAVRQFFGVLLLAVAIWIVTPVIPAAVQMLLWAGVLVGSGVFLGALEPIPQGASGWRRLSKAVGVLALLAGAAQGVGALSGARDPVRPLAGLFAQSPEAPLRFETVKTLADLDARLKTADKAVMLDFYADWCVSCKEMERFTFSDPQVHARLGEMTLLRADVTANSAEDKALLKRYRLFGPPGIVFFDAGGREIEGLRVIGYQSPEKFIRSLDLAFALGD